MTIGIYIAKSPSNKYYVGQSIEIETRIGRHKYADSHFGRAIRKYGWDNIKFRFVPCPEEFLDLWEKFYIHFHDSYHNGYNKTEGGQSNGTRHKEWSEERKLKPGPATGSKHSKESKLARSKRMSAENNPFFGKNHDEETRKKCGIKPEGFEPHNKGKSLSVEIKQKISENRKGIPNSPETCKKISIANTGIKQQIITCPHCGKTGGHKTMPRWHFENCKLKQ